jgi:hypothetical protein
METLESVLKKAGWSDELILHFTKPEPVPQVKIYSSADLGSDIADKIEKFIDNINSPKTIYSTTLKSDLTLWTIIKWRASKKRTGQTTYTSFCSASSQKALTSSPLPVIEFGTFPIILEKTKPTTPH